LSVLIAADVKTVIEGLIAKIKSWWKNGNSNERFVSTFIAEGKSNIPKF